MNPPAEEQEDIGGSVMNVVFKELREKLKVEDEEAEMISPFAGLEKSTVLQEANTTFNDSMEVKNKPQRCCLIITKLLFLLAQGEKFSDAEVTGVFFAVTKLIQSQDLQLRRMTYLFIKEIAESTDNQDIIIITASLQKDMNSPVDLFRANSIRVLCKIIDSNMLGQIERYIKQAVVDRNALISSSALISGNQMVRDPAKREIVRRWVNEVQEAVNSRSEMVQYHALSLLYSLKAHDKLAVGKLVSQLSRSPPRSPLAMCLLVRYTSRLLRDDLSAASARAAFEFLESCLRHKSKMVMYEAARSICQLPDVDARELQPAINVLQVFLDSPKPTLRFAAVRTLNQVAMKHPLLVTKCNDDMEALIQDSNRSIATLATTTLLKTGSESSVDRLMKQISTFMSDIADEFKIVVVRAIRALCVKYPAKTRVLLNFLSTVLREEGGFDFKKVIVDTILELMDLLPETKESGLLHLCEFIEDCEFSSLSAQILHVLGEVGPKTKNPAKYIRFIYNRVILENAHVRAASASSLGKFAAQVPSLRPSITALLRRCLADEDDEVRDRATIALSLLGQAKENEVDNAANTLLDTKLPMKPETLLRSLELYQMRPAAGPVTMASLPVVEEREKTDTEKIKDAEKRGDLVDSFTAPSGEVAAVADTSVDKYAEELYKMPEFASYGPIFKSSRSIELTEPESEQLVRLVKHVFADHLVLQFNLTNTLEGQLLADVEMVGEVLESDLWEVVANIGVPKLPYDITKPCYIALKFNGTEEEVSRDLAMALLLKFQIGDAPEDEDDEFEGFDEEFQLDDVEVNAADFIKKLTVSDFRTSWDTIGKDGQVIEKFQLAKYKSVNEAVLAIIDFLQMYPCEGTAAVASGATEHILLLAGSFIGDETVLARTKLVMGEAGVLLQIAVRSSSQAISETVLECING